MYEFVLFILFIAPILTKVTRGMFIEKQCYRSVRLQISVKKKLYAVCDSIYTVVALSVKVFSIYPNNIYLIPCTAHIL